MATWRNVADDVNKRSQNPRMSSAAIYIKFKTAKLLSLPEVRTVVMLGWERLLVEVG